MLTDNTLFLSDKQDVTASAASTNVIDQMAAGDAYNALWLVVKVKETFATLTSLDIAVETDSAAGFGTKKVLASVPAIKAAELTEGAEVVKMRLPVGCERYIRLYYKVNGSNATAGKVSAFLTPMPPIK